MRQSHWFLAVLATMGLCCSQAPLSEPPGAPAGEAAVRQREYQLEWQEPLPSPGLSELRSDADRRIKG
jgi:hypothetical protein